MTTYPEWLRRPKVVQRLDHDMYWIPMFGQVDERAMNAACEYVAAWSNTDWALFPRAQQYSCDLADYFIAF